MALYGAANAYKYISTATATTVCSGSGILERIVVGTTAAGAITVADGANTIGVLKSSVTEGNYDFNCRFITNLVVTTASTSKITVVFRKR